jgi:hypothetical protein
MTCLEGETVGLKETDFAREAKHRNRYTLQNHAAKNGSRSDKSRSILSSLTAVFTFAQKKEGIFLNFGCTAVSFLLVSLAITARAGAFWNLR